MGEYKEGYREFKGKEEFPSNVFYTTVALFIWLGIIHFLVLLVLFTVFFLPLTKSLMSVELILSLLLSVSLINVSPNWLMFVFLTVYLECSSSLCLFLLTTIASGEEACPGNYKLSPGVEISLIEYGLVTYSSIFCFQLPHPPSWEYFTALQFFLQLFGIFNKQSILQISFTL